MSDLLFLFLTVLLLNIIPVFAPPTWLTISWVGFNFPNVNPVFIALVAAMASTTGRLILAKMAQLIVRNKLLSDSTRNNIDVVRRHLEAQKTMTAGGVLIYAFSPFPSNCLFIAYGLTALPAWLIAIPFFMGRFFSYAAWAFLAQTASSHFDTEIQGLGQYFTVYFVLSQVVFLALVYLYAKIDWHELIYGHKLRWLKPPEIL